MLILLFLFLSEFELKGAVGCAMALGEKVVVSMIQDHEVLLLDGDLNPLARFGELGDGPQALNRPYGLFQGTDGIWVYNLGNGFITVLDQNLNYLRRFRAETFPIAQSAKDPNWLAGLGWDEVWRTFKRTPKGLAPVARGGEFSRANRAIQNSFQYHLVLVFAKGKVLWADGLDRILKMDHQTVLEIEETARPPDLNADPRELIKALDYMDYFPRPGFCFLEKDREIGVVVVQNADKGQGRWRTFLIDDSGQVRDATNRDDYPICRSGQKFLVSDEEKLYWLTNFYSRLISSK